MPTIENRLMTIGPESEQGDTGNNGYTFPLLDMKNARFSETLNPPIDLS